MAKMMFNHFLESSIVLINRYSDITIMMHEIIKTGVNMTIISLLMLSL